ncbi:MAG: rod shape-determining protein RodA [Bacteroidales bacterium]|nr:rod shape-determining protein RodA [Candidatus Liminaster caballi]
MTMSFFKSFDWITLIIYIMLVVMGWFTINAASYTFDNASIFDFSRPSGKQAVWFGLSVFLIILLLCIDAKTYMGWAPFIYIGMMILLLVTIFIGTNINGSHSWIKIGTFSIQPAEFGKFSTSLMVAWLFSQYGFKFTNPMDFAKVCLVVILPVILIILQNETGSALVYFSLILLFYRQGLSGVFLWGVFCAILIFVLGVKYSVEPLPDGVVLGKDEVAPPSMRGEHLVLAIIPFLTASMLWGYAGNAAAAIRLALISLVVLIAYKVVKRYVEIPAEILPYFTFRIVGQSLCVGSIIYALWRWIYDNKREYLLVAAFAIGFIAFQYSVGYAFHNVLKDHQRGRIEILLGMKEDLKGDGYNVNQAKIAIGSGGIIGKGYLQGTQTKLSYVPEQETDFIFCTIGEEKGFIGTSFLLLTYLVLILRIIVIAERQRTIFAQVYSYCVACIFMFHVFINVGMVIGLVPVIGIPLPFFSYGGSGLWSFTILLFIMLKLDASRIERY